MSSLFPPVPCIRYIIIPISPFRTSQQDIEEIGFLGLGATKSSGHPLHHRCSNAGSDPPLRRNPKASLLQQHCSLILNQPGLALLFVSEVPFSLSYWDLCPWIRCLPLALFALWFGWSTSSCSFLRKG